MTSTFPWHQSVTAFCQWTILRGSYDAFRRSVCSNLLEFCPTPVGVSMRRRYSDRADCRLEPALDRRARPGGRLVRGLRVDRLHAAAVPDARWRVAPRTRAPRTF